MFSHTLCYVLFGDAFIAVYCVLSLIMSQIVEFELSFLQLQSICFQRSLYDWDIGVVDVHDITNPQVVNDVENSTGKL
jgi:hypothetical protein